MQKKSISFKAFPSQFTPRITIRKSIPRRSKSRRAQMDIYIPLMLLWLDAHRKCQRCGKKSDCIHHWAGRRGAHLLIQSDWRASCDKCNLFAKSNPEQARAEGWLAPIGVYKT